MQLHVFLNTLFVRTSNDLCVIRKVMQFRREGSETVSVGS